MNRRPLRPVVLLVAGAMLVGAVFAIERGLETLGIAVAFKAKMLCSGVFLSDWRPQDVLAELQIDDLAPLRFIRTRVDPRSEERRVGKEWRSRWSPSE